jgi:hypothetical protein
MDGAIILSKSAGVTGKEMVANPIRLPDAFKFSSCSSAPFWLNSRAHE